MKKIICLFILSASPTLAQSPTIVYGASQDAPGQSDIYIVEQPKNAPNPLGNPIVLQQPSVQNNTPEDTVTSQPTKEPTTPAVINQETAQNPPPFTETPQQQEKQIENTLYQGGNRIYDVQSFPLEDIKTITEPNIQPTITTYPEY